MKILVNIKYIKVLQMTQRRIKSQYRNKKKKICKQTEHDYNCLPEKAKRKSQRFNKKTLLKKQ